MRQETLLWCYIIFSVSYHLWSWYSFGEMFSIDFLVEVLSKERKFLGLGRSSKKYKSFLDQGKTHTAASNLSPHPLSSLPRFRPMQRPYQAQGPPQGGVKEREYGQSAHILTRLSRPLTFLAQNWHRESNTKQINQKRQQHHRTQLIMTWFI